jgi:2-oxo-4-hydroxy-4-carboxy--5-ureidoimidazoline (OHCU) decarboxylase
MFAVSMPNSATRSAFVETATKCFATAPSSPSWPTTQSRAERAFVSVSSVPKVLDEMMNSVSSAYRSRVASAKSVESTLETKRNVRSRRV